MTRPANFSGRCRMIVADLDGTFLDSAKRIPPENLAAVREAQRAGLHFACASGRCWKSLREVMGDLNLTGLQLADNGSTIVEAPQWRVLESARLPADAVRMVWELSCQHGFTPQLATPDDYFCYDLDEEGRLDMLRHHEYPTPCATVEELLSHLGECCKLTFFAARQPLEARQAFVAELNRQFADRAIPLYSYFTESEVFCVASTAVSKLSGIEKLCARMGCTLNDVVALGDGDNDAEMLAGCGLAFAMANATPRAKAAATHLVASCDDAGTAQAIRIVLNGNAF